VLGCGILVALGHHNGSKTRFAGCNGDVFGALFCGCTMLAH
jgi:cobalamin synthase